MSQQRQLIDAQNMFTDSVEGDSDYTAQAAQDRRLKRKAFRRTLLICVVAFAFILITAGIAVGVVVGTKANQHNKAKPGNVPPTATSASSRSTTTTSHTSATSSPTAGSLAGIANSKVLNYMDTFYDPCENFYEYSCGNWRNSHPDAKEWGTFDDLRLDNYNKLAGYLSQYVTSHDPDAIKKAKYIYSACTDTDYIDDNYVDKAKSIMINKGGGWENGGLYPYESWSVNGSLYKDHYLGSSAFFTFGILPDDLNSSKPVITIRQDGLTYSPEKYFDDDYDLASVIEKVLDALDPYGLHYFTARAIANFEHSLASHWVSKTDLRNATAVYNPMTLDELTEIFSLDWISYFNRFFQKAGYSGSFSGSTVVIVETPSYFRAVNSYLTGRFLKWLVKLKLPLNREFQKKTGLMRLQKIKP